MNSAWTEYGLMRKPAQEDELVNKQIEESDSEDADKKSRQKKWQKPKTMVVGTLQRYYYYDPSLCWD